LLFRSLRLLFRSLQGAIASVNEVGHHAVQFAHELVEEKHRRGSIIETQHAAFQRKIQS